MRTPSNCILCPSYLCCTQLLTETQCDLLQRGERLAAVIRFGPPHALLTRRSCMSRIQFREVGHQSGDADSERGRMQPHATFEEGPVPCFCNLFLGVTLTGNKLALARHRALFKCCMGLHSAHSESVSPLCRRQRGLDSSVFSSKPFDTFSKRLQVHTRGTDFSKHEGSSKSACCVTVVPSLRLLRQKGIEPMNRSADLQLFLILTACYSRKQSGQCSLLSLRTIWAGRRFSIVPRIPAVLVTGRKSHSFIHLHSQSQKTMSTQQQSQQSCPHCDCNCDRTRTREARSPPPCEPRIIDR